MVARVFGWLGLLLVALAGMAVCFVTLYLFAPVAPVFWLLIALPIVLGATVAASLARYVAVAARIRRRTAAVVAGLIAALPLGGLVGAVLLSPVPPQLAKPDPDPRGTPRMVSSPTGAMLATWTRAPSGTARRTPVVFLHGGPGSFVRNRDFDAGAGLRAVGFATVYYDQSGSGGSSTQPTATYTVANAVADLEAVRAALGAERMVVWGQSWGASLAAAYTRAHPNRVAALLLDSPGDYPGFERKTDYSGTDWRGDFEPTLREATLYLLINHAPQLADAWEDQAIAQRKLEARSAKTTAMFGYRCKGSRGGVPRPGPAAGFSIWTNQLLRKDLNAMAPDDRPLFMGPALLVRGSCDFIPLAAAQRFERALPRVQRIDVPERGHGFFGSEAEFSAIFEKYARERLRDVP